MIKFSYNNVKYRYCSKWFNYYWIKGFFIKKNKIKIHEGSSCINYAQQCFEGIRCSYYKNNILNFKLENNIIRLQKSCKNIFIPILSMFFLIKIIKIITFINMNFIPYLNYGYLYIRPIIIGIGNNLGVKTSKFFRLQIFCCPVYIKKKIIYLKTLIKQRTTKNKGNLKIGSNYITNLFEKYISTIFGFNEILFVNNFLFEENLTSNILLFNNKIINMYNKNILFGTNRIILTKILKKKKIINLKIKFNNINNVKVIFTIGTANTVMKVNSLLYYNKLIFYKKNKVIKFVNFFFKYFFKKKCIKYNI